jgi:hypothetical protein
MGTQYFRQIPFFFSFTAVFELTTCFKPQTTAYYVQTVHVCFSNGAQNKEKLFTERTTKEQQRKSYTMMHGQPIVKRTLWSL